VQFSSCDATIVVRLMRFKRQMAGTDLPGIAIQRRQIAPLERISRKCCVRWLTRERKCV
jgi:hypothetical protein